MDANNKKRLCKLMRQHGTSSKTIAELLATVTGDRLSARTVQSWCAPVGLVSARPCPGWAIYILEAEFELRAEEESSIRFQYL